MQAERLALRHDRGVTPIWIGSRAIEAAGPDLDAALGGRQVFVVTSPQILALHRQVAAALAERAGSLEVVEVADGEAAKSIESATALWRRLLVLGAKRDACVVAFGGGSIGDLAGFVAATLLRGLDFVQIPTSLLAQVDAAIGGKTAINMPEAKNSVGAFHHPVLTVADTTLLATLPGRELRSGLFEIVKTAAVLDAELFARLEKGLAELAAGDESALAPVVAATAAAKIRLVEEDPREADRRRLLNFGHTLGHALETVLGPRSLSHGEAVGHGMLFALEEAEARGLAAADAARIRRLVETLGLPSLERAPDHDLVAAVMARDKKARQAGLALVLPAAVGAGEVVETIDRRAFDERLQRFLASMAAAEVDGAPAA